MEQTLQQEPVIATIVESIGDEDLAPPPVAAPVAEMSLLEKRVLALEQMLGELHAKEQQLETRITARVLEQIPPPNGETRSASSPWYQRYNPFRRATIPLPSTWLLIDLANELRFTFTMLLDRKFAMSWTSRGMIVASIVLAFTWSVWLSPITLIPFLGTSVAGFLDKVLTLLCGGLLFKVVHREVRRYRGYLENEAT